MFVDLSVKITPKMVTDAQGNEKKSLAGHLGTHFDVMDKEFPLEYLTRRAVVFDVSGVKGRDIQLEDFSISKAEKDMAVLFCSEYIEHCEYGSREYFQNHPQLSREVLEALAEKQISIIGVDFAGVRRGKEHTPMDQYLADRGIFVVENLCSLKSLPADGAGEIKLNTYPVNYAGMTGLPCRVAAEI